MTSTQPADPNHALPATTRTITADLLNKLSKTRTLVVGAGGIGCELLKNLVLAGFDNIDIVDLDTIEVSNLNRQFLFRRHHVGFPKAVIAREAVLRFKPSVTINAFQINIVTDPTFTVGYLSQFDLVFSALDNAAARLHLNKLCYTACVPIFESGTTGYDGQASIVAFSLGECYNCIPHPPPVTFPMCTIRKTPQKPEHCIAWAKHVYGVLFDQGDASTDGETFKVQSDDDLREFMAHFDQSGKPFKECVEDLITNRHSGQFNIVTGVHKDDLAQLVSSRRFLSSFPQFTTLQGELYHVFEIVYYYFVYELAFQRGFVHQWSDIQPPPKLLPFPLHTLSNHPFTYDLGNKNQQSVQTWEFYTNQFITSCYDLMARRSKLVDKYGANASETFISFDKDDDLAMSFVTAAANMRMYVYSIPMQSEFAIKGIAGNIINATATANAVTSGCLVNHALQYLQDDQLQCFIRHPGTFSNQHRKALIAKFNANYGVTWLTSSLSQRYIACSQHDSPNITCFCSRPVVELTFSIDHTLDQNSNLTDPNPFSHLTVQQFSLFTEGVIGGLVYKSLLDTNQIIYGSSPIISTPSPTSRSTTPSPIYSTTIDQFYSDINLDGLSIDPQPFEFNLSHLLSDDQRASLGEQGDVSDDGFSDDDEFVSGTKPLSQKGFIHNTLLTTYQLEHKMQFNMKLYDETKRSDKVGPDSPQRRQQNQTLQYPHTQHLLSLLNSAPLIQPLIHTLDIQYTSQSTHGTQNDDGNNDDSAQRQNPIDRVCVVLTLKSALILRFSFSIIELCVFMGKKRKLDAQSAEEERLVEEKRRLDAEKAKKTRALLIPTAATTLSNPAPRNNTEMSLLSDEEEETKSAVAKNRAQTHISLDDSSDLEGSVNQSTRRVKTGQVVSSAGQEMVSLFDDDKVQPLNAPSNEQLVQVECVEIDLD